MSNLESMDPPADGETPVRTGPIGAPFCRVCDYDLSGCTDSAKCPECGGALVDVLMRPELQLTGGTRKRSKARIMGMPAIDIAFGPSANERVGRARGFLAIGDDARGVVAIGGKARGLVAIGGFAVGGIALGGTSIGGITNGGASVGLVAIGGAAVGAVSTGGLAVGIVAQGGAAVGFVVRGGAAIGQHALGGGGPMDPLSGPLAGMLGPILGGTSVSGATFIMPMLLHVVGSAVLGGLAWLAAWNAMNSTPGWDEQ